MALTNITNEKKSNATGRIEDGTYAARIVQIIDLGIQENEWEGVKKEQHQVQITFEFPTERVTVDEVDKPRWLGKAFVISTHEKATLTKLMQAADPDGKDTMKGRNLKGLMSKPLMVTGGSTATGNAKIAGVARLMKGLAVAALENPATFFDLDGKDTEAFDKFPKWLKERIMGGVDFESTNFAGVLLSASNGKKKDSGTLEDMEDDNPF